MANASCIGKYLRREDVNPARPDVEDHLGRNALHLDLLGAVLEPIEIQSAFSDSLDSLTVSFGHFAGAPRTTHDDPASRTRQIRLDDLRQRIQVRVRPAYERVKLVCAARVAAHGRKEPVCDATAQVSNRASPRTRLACAPCPFASSSDSLLPAKQSPVRIWPTTPALRARSTTAAQSSSCARFPRTMPRKTGSLRLLPMSGAIRISSQLQLRWFSAYR